ncbi:hypothetical protein Patl1_09848 [Pistacia atlantica]|uniref:Uncharacterized protein n=1 Tax=Pistacia atlantica TaxID=434234 RepID=A0ACC1A6G0_9ROSI|nr:hypothetical protein Patl1_09848 [Pistacia atlantica]
MQVLQVAINTGLGLESSSVRALSGDEIIGMTSSVHESATAIRLLASLKASLCVLFASQIFLAGEQNFPIAGQNPIGLQEASPSAPPRQATAQFQELVHAYEVLSDPKELAWNDSHRSQILFSDLNSSPNSRPNFVVPNLFSYFSNTAFYGFGIGHGAQAPIMGNLESLYSQVTAFHNYWLGFSTVMDFCWVNQYDVRAGPNRKSRRVMEEENKKLRKKAKREYNETVRGLAEFD